MSQSQHPYPKLGAWWAKVRQIESSLKESHPNGVFISTLKSDNGTPAGLIKLAFPFVAAQCLANRTHEIATAEQIAEHDRRQETEYRHLIARSRHAQGLPDVFLVPPGGSR